MIPLSEQEKQDEAEPVHSAGVMDVGTPVRIIRDPHFGVIGTVAAFPQELQILGSESKARILDVNLSGGDTVTVPRANVELIEE